MTAIDASYGFLHIQGRGHLDRQFAFTFVNFLRAAKTRRVFTRQGCFPRTGFLAAMVSPIHLQAAIQQSVTRPSTTQIDKVSLGVMTGSKLLGTLDRHHMAV